MPVRKTFWSLFATFFLLTIVLYIFRMEIKYYFIGALDVTVNINSISVQFTSSLYLHFALFLIPFIFLLANSWSKFRSSKQAWLFAGSGLVFGCIGYLLRWQLVHTTIENAPILGGMKPMVMFDQLQFEKYFLLGTLIGSLVVGLWMGYLNQKLTAKRNGKL